MATPKTITQLTERSGDLALTDEIEVQVSGATSTVKKALSYIKKLVIGTATIGGASTTDIPTLASVGTFTNKRHTNPKINSATDMYITGDAINTYMQTFITYNVANDFIRIAGLRSNAQDQLDAQANGILQNANDIADINNLAQRYDYNISVGAGASSYEITDTAILTSLGLTGYIDHMTAIISYYEEESPRMYQQASSGVTIHYKTAGAGVVLDKVRFAVTSGKSYTYHLNFKLI